MTVKKLVIVPDEILRKKSDSIEKVGQDEKNWSMIYLIQCITIKELD